jgi:hypothetical protein
MSFISLERQRHPQKKVEFADDQAKAYSFIVQILVTLFSNQTHFMDRAKDQQTMEANRLVLQGKKC